MSLNKFYLKLLYFIFYFLLVVHLTSFGQVKTVLESEERLESFKDTTSLEQVVLTGQINKQSIDKSVAEVEVISRKQIEALAANNIADVLNQTLNINITPDTSSGRSTVQLFGLGGDYFKILVDNIPLVGDKGFGSNIDLTQIDLNDIERIELVEGSSGALYGPNAVTGVLNIITKKKSYHKLKINASIQEETVGNEYNLTDKGRHVKTVKVSHQINDKWSIGVSGSNNNFKGFFNNKKGEFYIKNDSLRGYEWLPKNQYNAGSVIHYSGEKVNAFYKFSYLDETTLDYGENVVQIIDDEGLVTSTSKDQVFTTNRYIHHLNFSGLLYDGVDYDVSLSYQKQKKNLEKYTFYIVNDFRDEVENFEFESREVFFSRGTVSNLLQTEKRSTQFGYEFTKTDGFASGEAGVFNNENVSRTLYSYDAFGAVEYNMNSRLSLNAATRLLYSSVFDPQLAINFNGRYKLENEAILRLSVGTTPKTPTYDQLYTYFVDSNHDFRGNPNLKPEQGKSIFIHLKKPFKLGKGKLTSKVSTWFVDVKDKIESVIVNTDPLAYEYNNVDKHRNGGLGLRNTLFLGSRLKFNLNLSLNGTQKIIKSIDNYNDEFLWSTNVNSSFTYSMPKIKTTFSLFLKHTGRELQLTETTDDNGNVIQEIGEQSAFTWLDTSIKKELNPSFNITLGARNLTNIISVNTSAESGTAHNAASNSVQLGYGRSYYLKLEYKFKKK